ncbi:UNVERIFIED_CONTAM: hypothetical protein ABIC26_000110 [Paenibacillus sp. PvR008]
MVGFLSKRSESVSRRQPDNSAGSSLMWPLVSMYVFDELYRSMGDVDGH